MKGKKILVGTALAAAALYGGTAAAADYPPDAPPPSTVVSSSQSGEAPAGPSGLTNTTSSNLADTGNSDATLILEIGGAAVLAGAGLLFVTKRRRRVAPT
jgi:LPXTG-motif cell wall-anchored protein